MGAVICQTDPTMTRASAYLHRGRIVQLFPTSRSGTDGALECFIYEEDHVVAEPHAQVHRRLPEARAGELFTRIRELLVNEIKPQAADREEAGQFPCELFVLLSKEGMLALPFAAEYGGGAQPFTVYLHVLEELAAVHLTVGLGISVHTLACHAVAEYGTAEQRAVNLPDMLTGGLLGAYCLSETSAGSDAASLITRAIRDGDGWVIDGVKGWVVTHGGLADFYTVLARTGGEGAKGITAFLVPGDADGLSATEPMQKMGLMGSPTTRLHFHGVRVPDSSRIGAEGQGFNIAMSALDSARLGVAACAIGLAQAALDEALAFTTTRRQFGRPVADFQGLRFMLADMATQIAAGRALYLAAAELRDDGAEFTKEAAMAKLFCTDTAMRVTTDAVQLLGGVGYTREFPVERYLREAKVLQIGEGTNQIQRMVIANHLTFGLR